MFTNNLHKKGISIFISHYASDEHETPCHGTSDPTDNWNKTDVSPSPSYKFALSLTPASPASLAAPLPSTPISPPAWFA